MVGNHESRIARFISEETKEMTNNELLATLDDLGRQWDDYALCFDVESLERELKAEKARRGL